MCWANGLVAQPLRITNAHPASCFFFFSSRRRHTRFKCDWSSDVCSSDLPDLDMARWLDEDRFFGARYALKSAMNSTHRIDIPTLGTQSWQDEQVGTRMGDRKSVV